MKMRVGSLFSGIGGFDLGLERAGMSIEWQVENNDRCREVLKKHWPKTPCHYDITKIDWQFIQPVDLICGGFPCQPFSLAGKRRGKADDRYLWPEVVRCLDALRPTWFVGENVPGLIKMALDQVCADLESLGYTVWPVCLPACAVDAPHQRQRIWIIAHTDSHRESNMSVNEQRQVERSVDVAYPERGVCGKGRESRELEAIPRTRQDHTGETTKSSDVADAEQCRLEGSGCKRGVTRSVGLCGRAGADQDQQLSQSARIWLPEPAVGRMAHGVPRRVDRLRGLGNAVVPQIVEALGRMIMACTMEETLYGTTEK